MELLTLGLGLLLATGANVVLGTATAYMNGKFNKIKFKKGVVKAVAIMIAIGMLAFAGQINPDVIAIVVGDTSLNLYNGVKMLLSTGFVTYSALTLQHLAKLLKLNKTKKG